MIWRALAPDCAHCKKRSFDLLCEDCKRELRFDGSLPLEWRAQLQIAYWYRGGLADWLKDAKENKRPERFQEMKSLLSFETPKADFIISASSDPLSGRRRLFDSSYEFAKVLSDHWRIPLLNGVFERRPFLGSQKTLGFKERHSFLKKLIGLNPRFKAARLGRLLLVDDVFTTGATMSVHKALLEPLSHEIRIFCLLRAPAIS